MYSSFHLRSAGRYPHNYDHGVPVGHPAPEHQMALWSLNIDQMPDARDASGTELIKADSTGWASPNADDHGSQDLQD